MWICRAGQNAKDINMFIDNNKIYLPWEEYNSDFSNTTTLAEFRVIVAKEKKVDNKTTISNWSGQLYQFVNGISIGDYVLIPDCGGQVYHLATIIGGYLYSPNDIYHHSRDIKFILKNIPREIFNQPTQYSLRAYRTLFRAKNEEYILQRIHHWNFVNRKRNQNA